ncbi:hypothetical protein GVAV_000568 [Gurleya vavrai]
MIDSNQTKNKRLQRELEDFQKDPPSNCSAGPKSKDDFSNWRATIIGPDGTPYAGEAYELEIKIPPNYPFSPPLITFITPIYHCNIKNGSICLDILKTAWSPALTISKILLSISSLLNEPNPFDPLDAAAANLYINDRQKYDRLARTFAKKNHDHL